MNQQAPSMLPPVLAVKPFAGLPIKAECRVLPLQALFSPKVDYRMDIPQRLDGFMVTLFTAGQGQHAVDFQAYAYKAPTLLFVAQNQVHQWFPNPVSDGLVIAFGSAFLYQTAPDQALLATARIFDYALQAPLLPLGTADFHHFQAFFAVLKQEFEKPADDPFREEIMRSLLRTILLSAERLKSDQTPLTALAHYGDFVRFKDRVENDFTRTRNVVDYAQALGYSPKKLNQLSRLVLNKSAKTFIDERVLLEIKRLLVHTDLSIKEITEHIGFDEPTNLVKFFKRHMRQTPRTFREYVTRPTVAPNVVGS